MRSRRQILRRRRRQRMKRLQIRPNPKPCDDETMDDEAMMDGDYPDIVNPGYCPRHAQHHHRSGMEPVNVRFTKQLQDHYGADNLKLPSPKTCSTSPTQQQPSVTTQKVVTIWSLRTERSTAIALRNRPDFRRPVLPGHDNQHRRRRRCHQCRRYEPRAEQGGCVQRCFGPAHIRTEAGIIGLVGPVDAGDAKLHVDGFTCRCARHVIPISNEHLVHRPVWRHEVWR